VFKKGTLKKDSTSTERTLAEVGVNDFPSEFRRIKPSLVDNLGQKDRSFYLKPRYNQQLEAQYQQIN
jgi:hypothetical protein